jgi:hypothetical protein
MLTHIDDVAEAVVAQAAQLLARLVQHVGAEAHDQAGRFGERDEIVRLDHQAIFAPARERFEGHDPAGRRIDDRLIGDRELVAFERAAQRAFEFELGDRRDVQRWPDRRRRSCRRAPWRRTSRYRRCAAVRRSSYRRAETAPGPRSR